jgi:signal transduction histidine kinase
MAVVAVLAILPNLIAVHIIQGFWVAISGIWDWSWTNFASSVPVLLTVVVAERISRRWSTGRRIAALAAAAVVGAAIGAALQFGVAYVKSGPDGSPGLQGPLRWFIVLVYVRVMYGGLGAAILFFAGRKREAERRAHEARMAQAQAERQIVEARLQLLRAQIEPHFLFNSLASVKRLFQTEPVRGRALVHHLLAYLREAIPRGRARQTTLGEEATLAVSFLEIFKIRMGDRLRVRVDVPEDLRGARIPPLMLGTLVENAVKHGIGPRASGGILTITARRDGGAIVIAVEDDGVGFRAQSGPGVGLSNTRARLHALHGDAAGLRLGKNALGGVTATLRLPMLGAAGLAEAA